MEGHLRKRGDKWYYSFELAKVGGERKRIERVGGRTKKEAAAKMRQAMAEYENSGQLIDSTNMSVSDFFDYWMKNHVSINLRYNSSRHYKSIIENHIKPELGKFKISSINSATLQEFLVKKQKEGYSQSTLSHMKTILKSSLAMAVHPWQMIKQNPAEYIKTPQAMPKEEKEDNLKIISTAEFAKMIELFPAGHQYHIPLQIGFHTGLRPGEICALQWDDINFKEKLLTVNRTMVMKSGGEWVLGDPKTKSSKRTISISFHLVKILEDHKKRQTENKLFYGPQYQKPDGYDFVCTKENGKPVKTQGLKYMARLIKKELRIDFHPHSLRHTHASLLYEDGIDPKLLQERLGHAKLSITMDTYAHITEDLKKKEQSYLNKLAMKSM